MDLSTLIEAASSADAAGRQAAVRAALAGHTDLNLRDLETAAAAEFQGLSEPGANGFDGDAITRMGVIADVVDAVRAEHADRSAAAVADLAQRVGTPSIPVQTPVAAPAPVTTPAPPAPVAEAAPSPVDTPETVPATPGEDTTAQPSADLVLAQASPSPAVTRPRNQVPMTAMPVTLPTQRAQTPFTITAAADLPGHNMGADLGDLDGLTEAVMTRFGQLNRAGADPGGTRAGIGSIVRERPDEFVAETQHDWQVIDRVCDETRLPGGSLLAAATPGWCAPCETSYDFCPVAVVDGLIDVPTVTARRGCLTYPQSPEFHTIYSGVGWCFTSAQIDGMQANPPTVDPKPCYKIPCPDTTSIVLDPCGICLQVSILHERAYPEMVRYTVQQALVAHSHKLNARIIREMVAFANPVDLTVPVAVPPAVQLRGNFGPGAMATALEGIELQVEWLRYRHRMGINHTMEMVAPVWMRGILRADLSKRMGVDMLSVSNETLNAHLTSRGVRVQWVLDWQDSFSDPAVQQAPNAGVPVTIPQSTLFGGGTGPATAWPASAQVLIYPAGTYFLARMDVISLEGGLLDSTLLRRNERMALFIEEALKVGKRCFQSTLLTIPLCASGQTGAGAWTDCATTPKTATA